MMIPDDIGRKIDALIPPHQRRSYRYGRACEMMGGPSWYVDGLTPIMYEHMLDTLDGWGIDTSAVRSEIAAFRTGAAVPA